MVFHPSQDGNFSLWLALLETLVTVIRQSGYIHEARLLTRHRPRHAQITLHASLPASSLCATVPLAGRSGRDQQPPSRCNLLAVEARSEGSNTYNLRKPAASAAPHINRKPPRVASLVGCDREKRSAKVPKTAQQTTARRYAIPTARGCLSQPPFRMLARFGLP